MYDIVTEYIIIFTFNTKMWVEKWFLVTDLTSIPSILFSVAQTMALCLKKNSYLPNHFDVSVSYVHFVQIKFKPNGRSRLILH